ncbi:MAG: HlyD family secretion protein [Arcticibacterium sp.]|jgi:HlyD family secretion protein
MKTKYLFQAFGMVFILSACGNDENNFDASGVFEAKEIIVSSETGGKILEFDIEEGATVAAGQVLGLVDCENLNLQRAQIEATIESLKAKRNSAGPQVDVLKQTLVFQSKQIDAQKEQLRVLLKEQSRIEKLVNAEAVPSKQLDDLVGTVDVLRKQMEAAESSLNVTRQQMKSQEQQIAIANRAIMSGQKPMEEQIAQMDNMIGKCQIINSTAGTILLKYAEKNEVTGPGKPLYKLADMSELKLRAYVTNSQLSKVKVGEEVTVFVNNGDEASKEIIGVVDWISDKAEFTPKTIQTKDERSNLVYATKIRVKNDGFLKIGMYGEVKF